MVAHTSGLISPVGIQLATQDRTSRLCPPNGASEGTLLNRISFRALPACSSDTVTCTMHSPKTSFQSLGYLAALYAATVTASGHSDTMVTAQSCLGTTLLLPVYVVTFVSSSTLNLQGALHFLRCAYSCCNKHLRNRQKLQIDQQYEQQPAEAMLDVTSKLCSSSHSSIGRAGLTCPLRRRI